MLKVVRSKLHTLFIPMVFWLLGIVFATKISYHWSGHLLVLLCLILFVIFPKTRISFLLLLTFLLAWNYTSSILKPKPNELSYYLNSQPDIKEVFTYKVLKTKQNSHQETYYIIQLRKLNDYNIKGKLLLYGQKDSLIVNYIYQTPLTVKKIAKPHNPAEFNFQRYYQYAGIMGTAWPLGKTDFIKKESNIFQDLKARVREKIASVFDTEGPLALALFLGEKSFLHIDQDKLSELGLIHLFAVSGLHVGIIYLTILSLLSIFLNLNKARLVTSISLLFYGYICDWSPSVFRTVLIILIYNLTLVLQRKVSFIQLISLTLIIITIVNPLQLFAVGLHLSLLAFIALWIADRQLLPYLYNFQKKHNLKKWFISIGSYFIYSLSVFLFLTPLTIYHFQIISINALITNIFASPIVTLMINTILFSLIIPQNFFLQEYLEHVFRLLKIAFDLLIKYADYLPFFTRGIAFSHKDILFLLLSLFCAWYIYNRKKKLLLPYLALVTLLTILNFTGFFVHYQDQVICFDAGNADCTYLEFEEKRNLLIDTGSYVQYPCIVETSLLPYLKKRHISSLDCVVISHPHEDHYGGLSLLAKNIKIKELIIHKSSLKDDAFTQIISDLTSLENITVLQDTCSLWDGRIRFLHPDSSYESTNLNNNSLVALVNYDDYKLLFTGDIESEAEMRLIEQQGYKLKADFLKIAHHGSITSSQSEFLKFVNPHNCFIPAGSRDKEHFPDKAVVDRLNNLGINIHNGNQQGALQLNIKAK